MKEKYCVDFNSSLNLICIISISVYFGDISLYQNKEIIIRKAFLLVEMVYCSFSFKQLIFYSEEMILPKIHKQSVFQ